MVLWLSSRLVLLILLLKHTTSNSSSLKSHIDNVTDKKSPEKAHVSSHIHDNSRDKSVPVSASGTRSAGTHSRPNILVLLADDLGFGDLSVPPFTHLGARTPHLEAMAAAGLVLTNFHTAAPVCTPTRASILTGLFPWRLGIHSIFGSSLLEDRNLPVVPNVAATFLNASYHTAHVGKWHLGGLRTEDIQARRQVLHSYGMDLEQPVAVQKVPPHQHYGNRAIDVGVGVISHKKSLDASSDTGTVQQVHQISIGKRNRSGRKRSIGRGARQRKLSQQEPHSQQQTPQPPQQGGQKRRRGLRALQTTDQVTDATSTACDPATTSYVPGPIQHGFAEYVAMEEGQFTPRQTVLQRSLYHKGAQHLVRNDLPYWPSGHMLSERQALEAIRIMNTSHTEGRPFYLHVWFDAPHAPYAVHERFKRVYPLALRKQSSSSHFAYLTMISALDAAVGQIRAFLQQSGLAKDTLVVFTSDNGPEVLAGSAEPFRGQKRALLEGGLRVPCIFEWPGRIVPSTTTNAFAVTTDLFPTFLHAAGVSAWGGAGPGSLKIDGLSILDLLLAAPGVHRQVDYSCGRGGNALNYNITVSAVASSTSTSISPEVSSTLPVSASAAASFRGVNEPPKAANTESVNAGPSRQLGAQSPQQRQAEPPCPQRSRELHQRSVTTSSSPISKSQQRRKPRLESAPANRSLRDGQWAHRTKATPAPLSAESPGPGGELSSDALIKYRASLRFPFYPTLAAYYAALVPSQRHPQPQPQPPPLATTMETAPGGLFTRPENINGISKTNIEIDDHCRSNASTSAGLGRCGVAGWWDVNIERDDIYNGLLDNNFGTGQGKAAGAEAGTTTAAAGLETATATAGKIMGKYRYDPYPGYRDRTVVWFSATNIETSAAWKDGVKYVAEVDGAQHIYSMHRDDWRAEYRDLVRFPNGAKCYHRQLCRGVRIASSGSSSSSSSSSARNRDRFKAVRGKAKHKPAAAKTVRPTAETPLVAHLRQRAATFAKQGDFAYAHDCLTDRLEPRSRLCNWNTYAARVLAVSAIARSRSDTTCRASRNGTSSDSPGSLGSVPFIPPLSWCAYDSPVVSPAAAAVEARVRSSNVTTSHLTVQCEEPQLTLAQ